MTTASEAPQMPYISPGEVEDAGLDGQTWSHDVGSFCSNGSRNIVCETFPRGSFATTDWENATQ
jgi:hypothetical protein